MNNNYEGHDLKGTILRLERSSIYDGDGYRTVVFMKGYPKAKIIRSKRQKEIHTAKS